MESEAAKARYARLHEDKPWHDGTFTRWEEKPSTSHPYKYDMGVTQGVTDTDLRPTDKFLTNARAPWPPPEPEEVDSDDSP